METKPTDNAERELILLSQQGDKLAFAHLVQLHYQQAISLATYWTGNSDAAMDISQDAFVRIFRNIATFDIEKSFAAWLYTIVKHLSWNHNSRKKSRWLVFTDFLVNRNSTFVENFGGSEAHSGETDLEIDEQKTQIRRAMQQLSEPDREIILLKDVQDYTYKDISEMLNIPAGSVMSRLFYARKKLAKLVEKEVKDE